MAITEKFLVDTTNFKAILEKLRTADSLPDHIDTDYLEQLGFSNPPDYLVLGLIKDLNLLRDDDTPTARLEKFRDPETAKEAFAIGVIEAYEDLFVDDAKAYLLSKDEILQKLSELIGDEKSDLILKYMVNTFKVVTDYVGPKTLETVLNQKETTSLNQKETTSNIEKIVHEIAQKNSNGKAADSRQNESVAVAGGKGESGTVQQEGTKKETGSAKPEEKKEPSTETSDIIEFSGESNTDDSEKSEPEESGGLGITETESVRDASDAGLDDMVNAIKSFGKPTEEASLGADKKQKISASGESNIGKAYIRKAVLLQKLGRYEQALPALDEVFERFADSDNQDLRIQASAALIQKMEIAEKLELTGKLIPIYTQIIERLDASENNEIIESVDHAYIRKSEILLETEQYDSALETIDQAIHRFRNGQRNNDFLQKAMFKKAELLEHSGAKEKALEAYDAFLKTFG